MMQRRRTTLVAGLTAVGAVTALTFVAANAATAHNDSPFLASVDTANTKASGVVKPAALSPQLAQQLVATGSMPLVNGTAALPFYGYRGDGPMVPAPGTFTEASKTEPDKNTYLVLNGHHYLFQGHEGSPTGYVTRIDLDAPVSERVSLVAWQDTAGNALPSFDGSTWNPFNQRLLLTAENSTTGGVWQSSPEPGSKAESLQGVLGIAAYEGVQNDSDGNIWLVEDAGGKTINNAKLPNSFVYRFQPVDPSDLTKGGVLQALQVTSNSSDHHAITVPSETAAGTTPLTPDMQELHQAGQQFETRWVTLHDTATQGFTAYDANAAAKAAGATAFKRPENGVFRPGTQFGEFFFTETGDTNALSPANNGYGGWGSIMRLVQRGPSADSGVLSMFFAGDQAHTGLDNIAFASQDVVLAVEDAGDLLHSQRNALDSAYAFVVNDRPHADPVSPVRWLAEGRDASATIDSGLGDAKAAGVPGAASFQNDGDNEITGIHVSNGDPTVRGLLGARIPTPFQGGWRVFWTQQHGDNNTWEVVAK